MEMLCRALSGSHLPDAHQMGAVPPDGAGLPTTWWGPGPDDKGEDYNARYTKLHPDDAMAMTDVTRVVAGGFSAGDGRGAPACDRLPSLRRGTARTSS